MSRNAFNQCEREYNEREAARDEAYEQLAKHRKEMEAMQALPTTSAMLTFIDRKLGDEGRRRIESVRKADKVSATKAILIVYRSLTN